ncbi:MAG: hypothetical protein ACO1NZ_04310 [Adhaeribacter sp.]
MKRFHTFFSLLLATTFLVSSCQQDDHELGRMLDRSEVNFRVVQDLMTDPGGNTVILINETPETVAMWDYGTGRSNRQVDTVRFAFKGDYTIKFSAMTAGGIVEMEPKTIQVTENNLNYVNDPLWTALTGGVGEEKTWVLDIAAKGFDGPLYFYGTKNGWQGACMEPGGDCWNWNPVYKDNTWLMPGGDYGTMTFSLKNGPFVKVNHLKVPSRGEENGTFFLDVATKTLNFTDAAPLHDQGRDACVAAWGNTRLLSLTETSMQLGVIRTSCEGPALMVYNYVPKD